MGKIETSISHIKSISVMRKLLISNLYTLVSKRNKLKTTHEEINQQLPPLTAIFLNNISYDSIPSALLFYLLFLCLFFQMALATSKVSIMMYPYFMFTIEQILELFRREIQSKILVTFRVYHEFQHNIFDTSSSSH